MTELLPYNLVLWGGILMKFESSHLLLLCVCEAVARVDQFLKVLGKDGLKKDLSGSFKTFKFLKRLDVCAFLFKKCRFLRDFVCRTKCLRHFEPKLATDNLSEIQKIA